MVKDDHWHDVERAIVEYLKLREEEGFDEKEFLKSVNSDIRSKVEEAIEEEKLLDSAIKTAGYDSGFPDKIGEFKILSKVGSGGMGIVFKAQDNNLNRRVAIKVMPWVHALDKARIERFHREAQAIAKLEHEGIVRIYRRGIEKGIHYLVMELVEGITIEEFINQHSGVDAKCMLQLPANRYLSGIFKGICEKDQNGKRQSQDFLDEDVKKGTYLRWAVRTTINIADALHHAHEKGVVHRDIKPSNILLAGGGKPKVMDFGLALLKGASSLTGTNEELGTVFYMSPEQAKGRKEAVDRRSDIYSLGLILYQLITLRLPVEGDDKRVIMYNRIWRDVRPPREWNPRVPKLLEAVLLKALERDPDKRYHTAQNFSKDLRAFLNDEPLLAKPQSVVRKVWRKLKQKNVRRITVGCCVLLISMISFIIWKNALTDKLIGNAQISTAEAIDYYRKGNVDMALESLDKPYLEKGFDTGWIGLLDKKGLTGSISVLAFRDNREVEVSIKRVPSERYGGLVLILDDKHNPSVPFGKYKVTPVIQPAEGWDSIVYILPEGCIVSGSNDPSNREITINLPSVQMDTEKYAFIPAGDFLMGNNQEVDEDEHPVHVATTGSYWIGKYEVSFGELEEFYKSGGYEDRKYWDIEAYPGLMPDNNGIMWCQHFPTGGDGKIDENSLNFERKEQEEFGAYLTEQGKNAKVFGAKGKGRHWIRAYIDLEKNPGPALFPLIDDRSILRPFPALYVSWYESIAYLKWKSTITGLEWRLPNEREWEKAARRFGSYIWPKSINQLSGNEKENSIICSRSSPHNIGIKTGNHVSDDDWNVYTQLYNGSLGKEMGHCLIFPGSHIAPGMAHWKLAESEYGCYNMLGNVWEWTEKGYVELPYGVEKKDHDWPIFRGGSFGHGASFSRLTNRSNYEKEVNPHFGRLDLGFRVVVDVK